MMWNLQLYPKTVLNERMWHFIAVKTYSDPSYIFSGGQDPNPPGIYSPVLIYMCRVVSVDWSTVNIKYVVDEMCCWCIAVDATEAGEGKLDVVIVDPNGQLLTSDITTDSFGAYLVSYTPKCAGQHRVDVYFNREIVTGKPSLTSCSVALYGN